MLFCFASVEEAVLEVKICTYVLDDCTGLDCTVTGRRWVDNDEANDADKAGRERGREGKGRGMEKKQLTRPGLWLGVRQAPKSNSRADLVGVRSAREVG